MRGWKSESEGVGAECEAAADAGPDVAEERASAVQGPPMILTPGY